MKSSTVSLFACLLLATAALSFSVPAFARGGAANLLNSPGYQRALEESRKRNQQGYLQQPAQTQPAAPRRKSKHRAHH